MAAEKTEWATRLAVKFIPADGSPEIITPIDNFTPSMDLPKEVIDSIDGDNLGYSFQNRRFTFDFEVKSVNKSIMRKLYATAVKGTLFGLGVAVKPGESDDWVFDNFQMVDCVVTNVSPVNVDNSGGVPTMKFSGSSLGVSASNDGQDITTDHTTSAIGDLS